MIKFLKKRRKINVSNVSFYDDTDEEAIEPSVEEEEKPVKKNKKVKKGKDMVNEEQINKAEEIMDNLANNGNVKILKKDRGLIERTESSKIVLTEDNRQVLED